MEFSNLFFLYLFLPVSLGLYYLMPSLRWKNALLLLLSLLFYTLGQVQTLPVLLCSALGNYLLAPRTSHRGVFVGAIGWNLALLLVSKLCLSVLPLGISFYSFSMLSYQADVRRGVCEPSRSFLHFLLYVSLFPKLLMGPIVRYGEIAPQLLHRETNARTCAEGAVRFAAGLGKKVLIADYAYSVYAQLNALQAGAAAWIATLFFMFYIYFEFSGCADMAIGLGRMFGFRYAENFRLPYTATSVAQFWRRWHITLGSFFRDYVYIPLGGSRRGKRRWLASLLIVWILTGLWHGTTLNFVLWGLYFFVVLALERACKPLLDKLPRVLRLLLTQGLVLIGWGLFSSQTGMLGKPTWTQEIGVILQNSLPLLLLCFVGASPLPQALSFGWNCLRKGEDCRPRNVLYAVGLFAFIVVVLLLCTASLLAQMSKPSLYASF